MIGGHCICLICSLQYASFDWWIFPFQVCCMLIFPFIGGRLMREWPHLKQYWNLPGAGRLLPLRNFLNNSSFEALIDFGDNYIPMIVHHSLCLSQGWIVNQSYGSIEIWIQSQCHRLPSKRWWGLLTIVIWRFSGGEERLEGSLLYLCRSLNLYKTFWFCFHWLYFPLSKLISWPWTREVVTTNICLWLQEKGLEFKVEVCHGQQWQ